MRLILTGHDYKYAVEQIMLSLFPGERPEYGGADTKEGMCAESRLTFGAVYAQAATVLRTGSKVYRGTARVRRDKLADKLVSDRLLQKIIKQSFYRAAAGILEPPPAWGSLTGIRPAKIAAAAMARGQNPTKVLTREYYVSPERAELCADAAEASLAVQKSLSPRDIALYVGIPFCPTRCAYCSFVSIGVEKSFGLIKPFVDALLLEIDATAALAARLGLRVAAVYIGGGTPTALSTEMLGAVMSRVARSFDLSSVREYTVEAGRPDTITEEKLCVIKAHGATRVSINPQSMSHDVLRAIGRAHTPEDTFRAIDMARRMDGLSLNTDVIAGLPEDSARGFCETLDTMLRLCPENITVHTLSLKKGSSLMLGDTKVPGGASVGEMLSYAMESLRAGGYAPYYLYRQKFTSGGFENTGWSRAGAEGIYNICMMEELCTVLSVGGGGVTKLVLPGGRIERIFNAKFPREYIQGVDWETKTQKIEETYNSMGGQDRCHMTLLK